MFLNIKKICSKMGTRIFGIEEEKMSEIFDPKS